MFARDKRIGPYTYVYLVENVREKGHTKQRIIANLGRKEVVVARGDLDRLARSVARLAQRSMVLSVVEGEAPPNAMCRRIGPALLFERLWQEVGCRAVVEALAAHRQFEFAAERATFLTVLHRLFVSARTAPRKSGGPTTASKALRGFAYSTSTAPWRGSASRWRIRPGPASWRRVAARILWRKSCSPAGATCLPSSASSSWIPPACPSRDRAARNSAGAATRKTTARISIR